MTTFSQLIDDAVRDANRPDMIAQATNGLNETIRELHAEPSSGTALFFGENRREALLTADSEEGFTWDIPTPWVFQKMETVYYSHRGSYAQEQKPSSVFANLGNPGADKYFYRTGSAFAFAGYGGLDTSIRISWFEYPPNLVYLASSARKVTWSEANQEYTWDASLTTPELKLAAWKKECNWMLERYDKLLLEGLKGKIWGRLGESEKGKLAYSLYSSWRPQLVAAEAWVGGDYYQR